jgi:hypothetical protein
MRRKKEQRFVFHPLLFVPATLSRWEGVALPTAGIPCRPAFLYLTTISTGFATTRDSGL